MMHKLYHVSIESDDKSIIQKFIPRIPEVAFDIDEECTIPRICVSSTIEGCLTSINSWESINVLYNLYGIFGLHELVRVYEFEIDNSIDYLTPNVLIENGWVDDANVTNEHWILQEIIPIKTYLIRIKTVDSGSKQIIDYDAYNKPIRTSDYYVINYVDYDIIQEEQLYNLQFDINLIKVIDNIIEFNTALEIIHNLFPNSQFTFIEHKSYQTLHSKFNFYDIRHAPQDIYTIFQMILNNWLLPNNISQHAMEVRENDFVSRFS